ncbi:MAG: FCD domain-containing protein [Pseudomonas sp.]|uniref:FadR/GntR family transcriptional regulator n=1 Tax=Pseudomonas TaxID=286 RepID=UPI0010A69A6D|nr:MULTISPECIES: FCD domain-containing protein [Pseudomonas]MBM3107495.1 FadR family transcriptional regulator [Pseudomonas arcuscaelestis]
MNALNTARSTAFIRLRQEGRTDEVARRLVEAIELGLFAEGQQLPSETELAMQLGVATVTLREALVVLRQRGLIETRRGRNGGSFVCAPVELPEGLLLQRLREMSGPDLRDLGDEQMAISGTAARLAAQRGSREQYARIAQHIDTLKQAGTRLARHRADARFHIEVAAAAQSLRLTHAEMRLQSEVGELLWLEAAGGGDVTVVEHEHRAILEALLSNDTVLAGALAEAHVSRGIKRLISLRLELLAGSDDEDQAGAIIA